MHNSVHDQVVPPVEFISSKIYNVGYNVNFYSFLGETFLFVGLHFTYKNFKVSQAGKNTYKTEFGIKLSIIFDKSQRNFVIQGLYFSWIMLPVAL